MVVKYLITHRASLLLKVLTNKKTRKYTRNTRLCFGVFSLCFFELSVPVQVIAWKDSSLKLPIMC